jgi:CRISPR-associated protein Cas1
MSSSLSGMKKPDLQALPRAEDKLTYLYLEKCRLSREDSALIAEDERGTVYIPANIANVLLIGPGVDITHRAMELIGNAGAQAIWVGESGVRYYASGRPLSDRSTLLIRQAQYVSNMRDHLRVARAMYQMRFPDKDTSEMTMQQLRGMEGTRVRRIYRDTAAAFGMTWSGRSYDPKNFNMSDTVNQSLSAGNVCLYGLADSVITSLGLSTGLGFIHTGHMESFSYDIGDLYKAETTIPLAFKIASQIEKENGAVPDIARLTRVKLRDMFQESRLLKRMVHDVRSLFLSEEEMKTTPDANVLYLWDDKKGNVEYGIQYHEHSDSHALL